MDLETRAWLRERIDGRLAAGVGIAWFVADQLAASLEPVTHQPEPWYGIALGVGFLVLLAAVATGLLMQRRWGLVMSIGAAGVFTALSIACPVSGHHPFGAWWYGQMACALGMLAGSIVATLRAEPRQPAPVEPGGPGEPGEPGGQAGRDELVSAGGAGGAASRG